MCIICVELASQKLTKLEAQRNLSELIAAAEPDSPEEDHLYEVYDELVKDWFKEEMEE